MTFRVFISSVQDEFAEERRRLKQWLTTDLFVSRFVEDVFLFEDVPSRGKPPQDVFLDEVKSSDIYIGLIGSQYYGKASAKRGVSATEQEYDAAGASDCERWVYLKAVDKRDAKAAAFVSRVNRDVTRTLFLTFEDLKSAVYASFVAFLDRRELIKVGDFDKSVCREMTTSDISDETVTWYLREMSYRKRKAALPITTTADELFTRLRLMKGNCYTWAAALCFSKNPQMWSYRTTLKCSWNEGVEFGRPFLDTDKYEGNLFELLRQGVDFVMSHIAQSRGLRTESFQAPMRFELPREVVEEALVNALVHRDWRLSASVEVRLFADRVEIWNPGALPEGITIPKLYETHSSYPVNELVLKVFDFAGVIESLGTGIKRMIETCRKEGLPDPTWEQNGSSFIVTIWKDMWTDARLREVGVTNRQMLAMPMLKTKHEMAVAEYMELTGVTRNTATADLAALSRAGVVKRVGAGRGATYVLQKCTINAQNAQSSVNAAEDCAIIEKKRINNAKNGRFNDGRNEGITGHDAANDPINHADDPINDPIKGTMASALVKVMELIEAKPGIRREELSLRIGKSVETVKRLISALVASSLIEHRGSKKTGGYYVRTAKNEE